MPVRMLVTSSAIADCTEACNLINGFNAEYVLADNGYDRDSIAVHGEENGIARNKENMAAIYIGTDIWSRMPF